jgi:hypothetical protein
VSSQKYFLKITKKMDIALEKKLSAFKHIALEKVGDFMI